MSDLLSRGEVEVLLVLVGEQHPIAAEAIADRLSRKQAGVTRALGALDAIGSARLVDAGWELTEQGRMAGLRIAASKRRAPRSVP